MDKLVRSIKFPFIFNQERLKLELNKILKASWIDHYNSNDYSGKWAAIALMSKGGKSSTINAFSSSTEEFIPTDALDSCDYFKEIINGFLFEKTAVRLLNLGVGAEVKPHRDHCLGYEDGTFRLHIPIVTNQEVEFILDHRPLTMKEGECWYFNANFLHSVKNGGDKDRIHLVIDGVRNEWTDQLFFSEADVDAFVKPPVVIDEDQKKLIIAELARMNSPKANALIENLKN